MIINKTERKNGAFTLAEVLITLGIIGVVAAMTIPNLVKYNQKIETISRLQKTYNTLSSVLNSSMANNSETKNWDWSGTTDMIKIYIVPYLSITKNCDYTNVPNSCISTNKTWLNKQNASYFSSGYQFILKDGTQYSISYTSSFIQFNIDLNGDKNPNMYGKDCFSLRIFNDTARKNKIFFVDPTDHRSVLKNNTQFGCNATATPYPGLYCGALIQMDSWQIKSDYPW